MDTKLNPNPNSCYLRAMPDEERFTLLGRDLEAPKAIRHWVSLRIDSGQPADDPQLLESLATANAMEQWRVTHEGEWRGYSGSAPDLIPTPSDEISSAAGRVLASKDPFRDRKLIRRFSELLAGSGINRLVVDDQKPTDDVLADALSEVFGRIYEDAHHLAGFAMRADRKAGPN